MIKPRIVFFGSGPVAARSLELLHVNFEIEAVVTKPKPEKHRGDFPTLVMAEKLGLKILTTANKKELVALFTTHPVESAVGVVIDYGIIIPQEVIDYFAFGIINSHFSLLPEWRGADPITFSILSGQKKTGVSVMLITAGLDEGPLLGQTEYPIQPDETTESLTRELIWQSDGALTHMIPLWLKGEISAAPQEAVTIAPSKEPTFSRKLTKEDGKIDWNKPAEQIEREIRAYVGWPKSYTKIGDMDVVITKARIQSESGSPGSIIRVDKKLIAYCGKDSLVIEKLIPVGKKEMDAQSFLNGYGKLLVS